MGKKAKTALLAVVGLLFVAQFFRSNHVNPPSDPAACFEAVANPSPQARAASSADQKRVLGRRP